MLLPGGIACPSGTAESRRGSAMNYRRQTAVPISRILSVPRSSGEEAVISLSDLPVTVRRRTGGQAGHLIRDLHGLAPGGVCLVPPDGGIPCGTVFIAEDAVVSYTTISPVSFAEAKDVCFCGTFRSHGVWPMRPGLEQVLPGTLPCGVRTFLPGPLPDRSDCLAPLLPSVT